MTLIGTIRELITDPREVEMEGLAEEAPVAPSAAEELISLEDDADLSTLVQELSSSLSDRRRDVLALYGAGCNRPQIADRLGVTERSVKRDLLAIMDETRTALARLAGGGCDRGEPLVVRYLCGLSNLEESEQARRHLSRCGRCKQFSERLTAWREKAGAMLPAPVAEGASPGVLGRIAESSADRLAALKQHFLDGGAQIKQHATHYRAAVDPTPLASARPGTAAAVIAGCLAIGGGATYCVDQGVDPLGAATGLIASEPEGDPQPATPPPEQEAAPVYTPEAPVEQAPAPESTPEPAASEPERESQPKPPPEDSFEPVAPAYQSSESEPEATYEAPAPEPAPAPASAGPQFGGP